MTDSKELGPHEWHCSRPTNEQPLRFGPIYLAWSEGNAGRDRGWGGSDIWACDEHPQWDGEDDSTEHWAIHGFDVTFGDIVDAEKRYEAENADHLRALELATPDQGHLGPSHARYLERMRALTA